ncbi:hypothetical protein [Acinetobacter variabilis]|uniref:hypothetical protein n=1 Tax=Acinetobacter variabilis TaxID=70346 RepID=UPI002899A095|nr:hypothetical protein [Acinetobacter variabilis]
MDILEKQAVWFEQRPLFEAEFIHSHLLPFFNFNENTGDYEIKSECVNNTDDEDRKVAYETLNTGWVMWLRAKRDAKAQSVPKVINVGNELQSWVAVWSFKARHDHEDYIVVDANLLAEKIEKLTGANA